MALGLIFTGPTFAASADDITEGVASSESTNSSEAVSEKTTSSTTETHAVPEALEQTPTNQPTVEAQKAPTVSTGSNPNTSTVGNDQQPANGTVKGAANQPSETTPSTPVTDSSETTPSTPVTDSSETTKPQNTSAETSVAKPKYHAALWEAAYDLQPKFPQTLIHHGLTESKDVHQFDSFGVKCGTTYQFDLYADDKITNALIAKGILNGGDESWPAGEAQVYNVFTTAPCPVVIPPAAPNPHAFQLVTCGQDIVTVTNDLADAKDRLTASFVVYDNGKFLDALVALAGKPTVQSYTFPEDSGVHVITVRTGPAFGDVPLDTKTVLSDCKPAVVVPPVVVEPPVVTPPVVETPVAPVAPPKAVLVADKRTEGLASTGTDPMPLVFGGGVLILLGIVGFAIARKRRTAYGP